jgi:hypothetical protein
MDYIIFIYEIQNFVKVESGDITAELEQFFSKISTSDAGFRLALKLHLKSLDLELQFFDEKKKLLEKTSRKVSWKDVIKQEIYNKPKGAHFYQLISGNTKNDPMMPIDDKEEKKLIEDTKKKAESTQSAFSKNRSDMESVSLGTKTLLERSSSDPMVSLSNELEDMENYRIKQGLPTLNRFSKNIIYNIKNNTGVDDLSEKIKTEHIHFFMSTLRSKMTTSNIYGKYTLDVIEKLIMPGFNGWCLLPCDGFKNVSYSSMVLSYEISDNKISRIGFTIDKDEREREWIQENYADDGDGDNDDNDKIVKVLARINNLQQVIRNNLPSIYRTDDIEQFYKMLEESRETDRMFALNYFFTKGWKLKNKTQFDSIFGVDKFKSKYRTTNFPNHFRGLYKYTIGFIKSEKIIFKSEFLTMEMIAVILLEDVFEKDTDGDSVIQGFGELRSIFQNKEELFCYLLEVYKTINKKEETKTKEEELIFNYLKEVPKKPNEKEDQNEQDKERFGSTEDQDEEFTKTRFTYLKDYINHNNFVCDADEIVKDIAFILTEKDVNGEAKLKQEGNTALIELGKSIRKIKGGKWKDTFEKTNPGSLAGGSQAGGPLDGTWEINTGGHVYENFSAARAAAEDTDPDTSVATGTGPAAVARSTDAATLRRAVTLRRAPAAVARSTDAAAAAAAAGRRPRAGAAAAAADPDTAVAAAVASGDEPAAGATLRRAPAAEEAEPGVMTRAAAAAAAATGLTAVDTPEAGAAAEEARPAAGTATGAVLLLTDKFICFVVRQNNYLDLRKKKNMLNQYQKTFYNFLQQNNVINELNDLREKNQPCEDKDRELLSLKKGDSVVGFDEKFVEFTTTESIIQLQDWSSIKTTLMDIATIPLKIVDEFILEASKEIIRYISMPIAYIIGNIYSLALAATDLLVINPGIMLTVGVVTKLRKLKDYLKSDNATGSIAAGDEDTSGRVNPLPGSITNAAYNSGGISNPMYGESISFGDSNVHAAAPHAARGIEEGLYGDPHEFPVGETVAAAPSPFYTPMGGQTLALNRRPHGTTTGVTTYVDPDDPTGEDTNQGGGGEPQGVLYKEDNTLNLNQGCNETITKLFYDVLDPLKELVNNLLDSENQTFGKRTNRGTGVTKGTYKNIFGQDILNKLDTDFTTDFTPEADSRWKSLDKCTQSIIHSTFDLIKYVSLIEVFNANKRQKSSHAAREMLKHGYKVSLNRSSTKDIKTIRPDGCTPDDDCLTTLNVRERVDLKIYKGIIPTAAEELTSGLEVEYITIGADMYYANREIANKDGYKGNNYIYKADADVDKEDKKEHFFTKLKSKYVKLPSWLPSFSEDFNKELLKLHGEETDFKTNEWKNLVKKKKDKYANTEITINYYKPEKAADYNKRLENERKGNVKKGQKEKLERSNLEKQAQNEIVSLRDAKAAAAGGGSFKSSGGARTAKEFTSDSNIFEIDIKGNRLITTELYLFPPIYDFGGTDFDCKSLLLNGDKQCSKINPTIFLADTNRTTKKKDPEPPSWCGSYKKNDYDGSIVKGIRQNIKRSRKKIINKKGLVCIPSDIMKPGDTNINTRVKYWGFKISDFNERYSKNPEDKGNIDKIKFYKLKLSDVGFSSKKNGSLSLLSTKGKMSGKGFKFGKEYGMVKFSNTYYQQKLFGHILKSHEINEIIATYRDGYDKYIKNYNNKDIRLETLNETLSQSATAMRAAELNRRTSGHAEGLQLTKEKIQAEGLPKGMMGMMGMGGFPPPGSGGYGGYGGYGAQPGGPTGSNGSSNTADTLIAGTAGTVTTEAYNLKELAEETRQLRVELEKQKKQIDQTFFEKILLDSQNVVVSVNTLLKEREAIQTKIKLTKELEEKMSEKTVLQAQLTLSKLTKDQADTESVNADKKIEQLKTTITNLNTSREELMKTSKEDKIQINSIKLQLKGETEESALKIASIQQQLEKAIKGFNIKTTEAEVNTEELEALAKQLEEAKKETKFKQTENVTLTEQFVELTLKNDITNKSLEETTQQLETVEREKHELEGKLEAVGRVKSEDPDDLKQYINTLVVEINRVNEQIQTLKIRGEGQVLAKHVFGQQTRGIKAGGG